MAQLAEGARFGNDGDPQLCNLRAGRPQLITPKSGEYKRTRRCRSDDEDDDEDDDPTAPTHVERRQGEACEVVYAEKTGVCSYCGYNKAAIGCKTCGVRFCSGIQSNRESAPFECMNRHLSGEKCRSVPRKEVKWWVRDEEEE